MLIFCISIHIYIYLYIYIYIYIYIFDSGIDGCFVIPSARVMFYWVHVIAAAVGKAELLTTNHPIIRKSLKEIQCVFKLDSLWL